jgi:hypothetical protein
MPTTVHTPTREQIRTALTTLGQAYTLATTFRAQNAIVTAAGLLVGRPSDADTSDRFEDVAAAAWQLINPPAPSDLDPELGNTQADADTAHDIITGRLADALDAFGA